MHFEAFQKLSESEFPRPPGRLYLGVPETIGMHQWRLTVPETRWDPDITDGVGERRATPQGWAGGHLSWRPARNWWQHVDLDPRHTHRHTHALTRLHLSTLGLMVGIQACLWQREVSWEIDFIQHTAQCAEDPGVASCWGCKCMLGGPVRWPGPGVSVQKPHRAGLLLLEEKIVNE